ncbi:MAG: hypothetical protein ACF8LL_07415, partial [Phycisphaerales bacterium]
MCSEDLATLSWLPEHGPMRQFLKRLVRTLFWTARPWRFWSQVRMEHRVVPRRLVAAALTAPILKVLMCDSSVLILGGVNDGLAG